MAPQVGLEPTTLRLTAGCSAIELLRSGRRALRAASSQKSYQSHDGMGIRAFLAVSEQNRRRAVAGISQGESPHRQKKSRSGSFVSVPKTSANLSIPSLHLGAGLEPALSPGQTLTTLE